MRILKPVQRHIRFCLPVVVLAISCCPATWSQPDGRVWDTGLDIDADMEVIDIALPIKVTDGPQHSDGTDLEEFVDWDDWVEYEQGEQVDEGSEEDLEGLIQWSTQAPAWVDPTAVWGEGTRWYVPSDGGKYWIKAVVDDLGEIGEGEYGTRDDDPVTVNDPPWTHAIAVEVVLSEALDNGPSHMSMHYFADPEDTTLGPTDPNTAVTKDEYKGFYKRIEIIGEVIPHSYTGDEFLWRQDVAGESLYDGADIGGSPWPPWSPDGEGGVMPWWHCTTEPDGNSQIYLVDWPGAKTGGWDAGAGSHTLHFKEYDGDEPWEPFEFRSRAKFKGYWCTKQWRHWSRKLVMYSNPATGNKWVATTNE